MIASDGDIEEGVTAEASSIAGRQQLGNLVVIYDDNHISIEDDTSVALDEDVVERYDAYGWHTQVVRGGENVVGIREALANAKAETDRPSFIALRTVIGYPAPDKMNTGAAHGAALGEDEVARGQGDPRLRPRQALRHRRRRARPHPRGRRAGPRPRTRRGTSSSPTGRRPTRSAARCSSGWRAASFPTAGTTKLPTWSLDDDAVATRKALQKILGEIGPVLPELWGGSADLAESNNTTIKGADSFGPVDGHDEPVGPDEPLRPHPALRRPRARDGLDPQRDRAARRHPRLRRHVPDLLRLHAARRSASRR